MKFRSALIATACAALVQFLPGVASADTSAGVVAYSRSHGVVTAPESTTAFLNAIKTF